jgi:hypothetical protein
VVLAVFLLPSFYSITGLVSYKEKFSTVKSTYLPPFLYEQIYLESEPIDILLIGASTLTHGVDARRLEDHLSDTKGRKLNVLTLGFSSQGDDLIYIVLKQLLKRRKVKHIFLSLPTYTQEYPHHSLKHLIDVKDSIAITEGLGGWSKLRWITLPVLSSMRHMISIFRKDILSGVKPHNLKHNGSTVRKRGWGRKVSLNKKQMKDLNLKRDWTWEFDKFEKKNLPIKEIEPNSWIHELNSRQSFKSREIVSSYQYHFFNKVFDLVEISETKISFLHMPHFEERKEEKIILKINSKKISSKNIKIIGIPNAKLFKGLSNSEVQELYFNNNHFNENGVVFFTKHLALFLNTYLKEL